MKKVEIIKQTLIWQQKATKFKTTYEINTHKYFKC